MADFNQALTVAEALRRGHMIDDEGGVHWIEEPVRADDFAGYAEVAQAVRTPIQIGENFMGPEQMAQALAAGASDYVMPDAATHRRGDRLDARRRARQGAGMEMSSHLFAGDQRQLLAVTPDRPLARVCRLGRAGARRAARGAQRACADTGITRFGYRLEREAVRRYAL